MADNITAFGLHPLDQIVNVHWGTPVWIFAVNVKGTGIPFAISFTCLCPTGPLPDDPLRPPPGQGFDENGNFTDSGTYIPHKGILYRSTDALKWTDMKLPNVGAGIGEVKSINGELIASSGIGGTTTATCCCNCRNFDEPPPIISNCSDCGTNAVDGAAAAQSIDKGKTWTVIDKNLNYLGTIITDKGPAGTEEDAPEKIEVKFEHVPTDVVYNLETPWPAAKYKPPFIADVDGKGIGDPKGKTFVRPVFKSDTKLILETTVDDGENYEETLAVTTEAGYLHYSALFLQNY
jgi:hypothetical protein